MLKTDSGDERCISLQNLAFSPWPCRHLQPSALACPAVNQLQSLLHELGHYLGLDEDELTDRGLE